uniref:Predicted protein n=1 Tax=Physcomitrium patens TaxID=3218 RepID=A9U652_PHYPA
MEIYQIPEAKMISSLHLTIEPRFQIKVKELLKEGNAKIKDLKTNDNTVGSYGYSILNKFVQVGDGNLDGKYLGDEKAFSTFEGGEDVLPNTLEEFKVEPLQKIDYGSIEGYNHEDCMNSQYYDVRSGGIMHGSDDESQIAYGYETTYELGERSYEFSYDYYKEGYEIAQGYDTKCGYETTKDYCESYETFQEHEISKEHENFQYYEVIQCFEITKVYDISQGCIQEDMKDVIQDYVANEDYGTKDKDAKSLTMIKLIVNTSLLDQGQSYIHNAHVIETQLDFDKDKVFHHVWNSRVENLKIFIYKDKGNGFKDYMNITNGTKNQKNKKKDTNKIYVAMWRRFQFNLFISNFLPRQWFGHMQRRIFAKYLHMCIRDIALRTFLRQVSRTF